MQMRQHRSTFDLDWLNNENHHQSQQHQRENKIPEQEPRFMPKMFARGVPGVMNFNVRIVVRMNTAER